MLVLRLPTKLTKNNEFGLQGLTKHDISILQFKSIQFQQGRITVYKLAYQTEPFNECSCSWWFS